MTFGLKTLLTLMAAALFVSLGLFAAAATHKNADDKNWAKKADESFYLSPGLAQKLLSKNQWDRYQQKMKDLPPDQLSSFRVDMHKMLMQEAWDRHIDVTPDHARHARKSQSGVSLRSFEMARDARLVLIAGAGAGCDGKTDMGKPGSNAGPGGSAGQMGARKSTTTPRATGDYGSSPGIRGPGQFGGKDGAGDTGGAGMQNDSDFLNDRGF